MFGGTGDLAVRKLLPALFHLSRKNLLGDTAILALGRRFAAAEEYLRFLDEKVEEAAAHPEEWPAFAQRIEYHRGDVNTRADFEALRDRVHALESARGLPGARLFYYAVGPKLFGPITERLADVGLLRIAEDANDEAAGRIVVEKPFGHDGASARALDALLRKHLDESQIYRIDHYLGKETVQNLLAFRFANGLFEPVWNYKYVSQVQITVAESIGVGERGEYYEATGAFRDMMQNHMLQLLALVAMEPPISLAADAIRDEKVKVLRALREFASPDDVSRNTVRGQYGPGKIAGQAAVGYRQEPGVTAGSVAETFACVRTYVDNWRWANVPFLLRHGKRMAKRGTEIAIQFTTPPLALFRGTGIFEQCNNTLVLRIQPNEGITLYFGAKTPGAGMKLANVKMEFFYEDEFHQQIPEAYERLLLDALVGDPTLYTRSDETAAMWRWADGIVSGWRAAPTAPIAEYPAGSWGPAEAESLLPHGNEIHAGCCPIGWRRW
jgi:glucose-6-phosphate 1-dehydrogenase